MKASVAPGRRALLEAVTRSMADPRTRGALLYAAVGMGKSTIADEVSLSLKDRFRVLRIRAEQSLATVPYGALFPLLNGVSAADLDSPLAVLRAVRSSLDQGSDRADGPLLLIVDDVHDLDEASSYLLEQLLMAGAVKILALCRSWESQPRELMALCQDGLLDSFEVPPLTPAEIRMGCGNLLGGPVATGTLLMLEQKSLGNPQLLASLVHQAVASGNLAQSNGIWRMLREPTEVDPGLTDLVKGMVNGLDSRQRTTLETVALAGELPWALAGLVLDSPSLLSLEELGLLTGRHAGALSVRFRFPAYADVVRSMVQPGRSAELLQRVLAVADRPTVKHEDFGLRMARWGLDAGRLPSSHVLLMAARRANDECDFPLAMRLAAAITEARHVAPAALESARAGLGMGDDPGASEAVGRIGDFPDQRTAAGAALVRAQIAQRLPDSGNELQRIADEWAAAGAEVKAKTAEEPGCLDAATGAWLLDIYRRMLDGECDQALKIMEAAGAEPPSVAGRLLAKILKAVCLAETGRFQPAVEAGGEAWALAESTASLRAFYPFVFSRYLEVLLITGHYQDAGQALDGYRDSAPRRHRWFSGIEPVLRGLLLFRQGRMKPALQLLVEGIDCLRREDQGLLLPSALGAASAAAMFLGHREQAQLFQRDLQDSARTGPRARRIVAIAYASAADLGHSGRNPWEAAATPAFATAILRGQAASARVAGLPSAEKDILELQAILGDMAEVDRLAELTGAMDGIEAQALHAFAQFWIASDPDGVLAAGDMAAEAGKHLISATAQAAASRIFEQLGQRRQQHAALHRLRMTMRQLEEVSTPATDIAGETGKALTAREQQIVKLVRQGATNKQIAQALTLSTRTAEGHLYRIYLKLGVGSREDLIQHPELLDC